MPPKPPGPTVAALSGRFGGAPNCVSCGKPCYANEQMKFNELIFHEVCFKCNECKYRIVQPSQAAENQGQIYHKVCLQKITKHTSVVPSSPSSRQEEKGRLSTDGARSPSSPSLDLSSTKRDPSPAPLRPVFPPDDARATAKLQAKVQELEGILHRERTNTRSREADLEAAVAKLQAELNSARSGRVVEENSDHRIAQLNEQVTTLQHQLRAAVQEATSLKDEVASLRSTSSSLDTQLAQALRRATEDAAKYEAKLKEKAAEAEAATKSHEAKTAALAAMADELKLLSEKMEVLNKQKLQADEELRVFEEEIVTLSNDKQQLLRELGSKNGPPTPAHSVDASVLRELAEGTTLCVWKGSVKETAFVWYEPDGAQSVHNGWLCWNPAGERRMRDDCRILLALPSRVEPAKQRADKPARGFVVSGAIPSNSVELETESDVKTERWIEGLRFLLKASRLEIYTMIGGDTAESLEQKQKLEELHKLEAALKGEVQQLNLRKQALLDAELLPEF